MFGYLVLYRLILYHTIYVSTLAKNPCESDLHYINIFFNPEPSINKNRLNVLIVSTLKNSEMELKCIRIPKMAKMCTSVPTLKPKNFNPF